MLLTQRFILEPQVELNLYSRADPRRLVGSGVSDLDAGLRLRYEIVRKFAPYIGVSYSKSFGTTAAFTRAAGGPTSQLQIAVGVRAWL